jgi:drug/metabolite transporter (DMT)-like permease
MKPRIILAMVVVSMLWGSTWMGFRVLTTAVPPMHSASLRFLLAAVILLPFIHYKRLPWPTGRGLRANLILSLTMIAVPSALIFWSQDRLSSGLSALIFGAMPLMAVILTPWLARRSVPRSAWQAMIVGLGGMGLVLSGAIAISLWQAAGAIAVIAAVWLYAGSAVYAREELMSVHPAVSTAIQLFLGGIWLALASLLFERGRPSVWNMQSIVALVLLSLFASAISFTLYYWLLQRIEAYQATSLQLMIPIIAVAEIALFMLEPVPWTMVVGALVALASVVLVMRAKPVEEQQIGLELGK